MAEKFWQWIMRLIKNIMPNYLEKPVDEAGAIELVKYKFQIVLQVLFLSTFVLVINRFRSNIYGRQGYLTMTLPVNSHQLILSKLVASLVWYFLAGIIVS